ncbi:Pep3/Vps18/deep orange family [Rhizoctonia solani]|uniref:Pep3/Vps18/deep orange family n=1 Tax=Rhizoctonia solani TaxID=456999 RepID=A0A8H7IM04_9AGAM|nr:Pep3/Vps18/deep orange family [Rhizoctonia solani]
MSEAITPANESVDTERVGSISQVSGHQHVLVACGDSFVGPLKLLNRGRVLVKRFSGASAKGLGNKNSVSQTGVLVTQLLDTYKPEQGEFSLYSDKSIYIYYTSGRHLRHNVTEVILQPGRLEAYSGDSGYLRNIFVASVIAPCVNQDDYLDESVRKYQRREEDAVQTRDLHLADSRVPTDIHTRRAMVQEFNAALSLFCEDNNVRFVDINKHIVTGEGEVKPEVLDHDPSTIHVQWESTIRYWVEELTEAGLTENDIHVDLNDSALQYEAEKKGRMQRRKVTAADATLSPTLSDYSVMSEDPGSPLLLPRSATWTRGRSSTPPPISHARTTQASPEHNSSWRGRMELGRGRGNTGSPPRGPKPSRFQFGSSSRNRAEKDDNWRSHARIHSASHVPSTADLTGVFQLTTPQSHVAHHWLARSSNNGASVVTPSQTSVSSTMFDEYVEHSGRPGVVTSPKTRALPQLHYEGFEPNTTAAGGLETPIATRGTPDEEPIFRLAPVQYTPPAQITNLVVSNNILIICFNNNNLHRIDMAMQDYIGELSLGKKPQEATVHKMFLDPSGKHLLITTAQGDNYYLYEGWKKSKQLGRLKMVIEAVAWNDEKLFPYSGGRNGTIYEALISPAEEFFKSPDRYVQAVYTLPDKQSVCGIKFERLKDDPSRAVVVIATASRLYQLVGPVGGKADTDGSRVFETLFASYNRDTPATDGSSRNPGGNNFPLGVVLTEFHFLLLLSDRVMGYSRLDDSLIYDEAISLVSRSFLDPSTLSSIGQRRAERLLGIVSDPINRTLWIYSTNGLYEVVRVDEERDVWKIYLDKADYALALKFAKLPRHRDTVLAAQGAAFFNQGQFIQAAQSYSQSASAPFEEVALKFVMSVSETPCDISLGRDLPLLARRAMLATWLIEFYLSKCNELDDLIASSSASNDVSNLQAEQIHLEEELQEFFETYKANLDRKTTYDLIRGHGRTDVFLDFAGVTGDFERIIEHWVSEEEWVKAIDVLHRQPDLELYYRFASAMIRSAPKETVDAWTRRPALDPIPNNDDGPLLRFLTTAPSDPISSRPYYDLDYALRICRTNGRIQPCVHIYAKMGLYEESVSLALEKGDLELAQITANMPEDDIQLRKKLWLKVARYVVEDKKDIKTAMQFLSNTELLKIEDICRSSLISARIVELKQDMDGAMESAAAVSRDISQLKNRFVIIEQGERCTQCQAPLLLRQFYAFPCQHTFHADCLIGLSTKNGQPVISAPVAPVPPSTPQASRASTQAQRTLLSATFATGGVNGSLTRALNPLTAAATMGSVMVTASDKLRDLIVPDALATAVGVWGDRGKAIGGAIGINHNHANEGETGSRIESLRAELDNVLAGSCPLCDSVVSGIDKPFINEGEIDTSWTI